jgi:anti-sigma B factor antagonist
VLAIPVPSTAPDPDRRLSVTAVRGDCPGRVVVEVVGEVDTSTAPLLQLCLDSQAVQRGLRELVVDLEQVTFLGAAGVTVLAQAHRRCRMRGARLVLRCAHDGRALRPLQLTGLADLVAIDPVDGGPALPRGGWAAARPQPTPRRPARARRVCR